MMSGKKGFSLIELMVVVAILSTTAAYLVPRYLRHQVQEKQEGCHRNLSSLVEAEKTYFKRNDTFTTDLEALGWRPEGTGPYTYRFVLQPFSKEGFLFECVGNIDKDPTLDQATIDETGQITQVTDDTRR